MKETPWLRNESYSAGSTSCSTADPIPPPAAGRAAWSYTAGHSFWEEEGRREDGRKEDGGGGKEEEDGVRSEV